jgi:four helix bundle protein
MSRDHRKLRVFHDAHRLTLAIYRDTKNFPKEEWFGMRMQIRRAAVSVPGNIVEGSARKSTREYCNFVNIALGSASELGYLISLASELGFVADAGAKALSRSCMSVIKQLQRLGDELDVMITSERGR